jgi:hypothetical protein
MYPKMYRFCNRLLDKDLPVVIYVLFFKMYFQVFQHLQKLFSFSTVIFLFSETTSAA